MFESDHRMRDGDDLGGWLDAVGAPGVGVMILRPGRAVRIGLRGGRIAGREGAVTAADRWHVGSCTKAMTVLALARLQARGAIGLDATLGEALPGMSMHPAFAATPLRAVLRHEAGLRRDPHWSVFARLRQTRATPPEQRRYLANLALVERPVAGAGYSNLGYIVLGAVMEAATGRAWEEIIRHEVFAPLGMMDAGFGAPPLPAPVGHVWHGGRWRPRPPGPWSDNPLAYGPAGRISLTLADWARIAEVYLNQGPAGYLPLSLLDDMRKPGESGYAAGWGTGTLTGGARMLRHTGSNTMWFADMRLVPARGIGVAVVANGYSAAVEAGVRRVADRLLADTLAASQTGPDAIALRPKQ